MTVAAEKPTILLLSTSSGPGGAERMISMLSAALNQSGMRVIVGLFHSGWLQAECERLQVETRVIPLAGWFHLGWFVSCLRLISEERVSLIHGHEFSAVLYGWIVAWLKNIPLVGTVHGKNYYSEKLRRRLAYRLIARTGRLIAVSEDLKRFIVESVGVSSARIGVIYNGVNIHPCVGNIAIEKCRSELGIREGDVVIGTVGSLYPVKGHRFLLDAMPLVLSQRPKAILLLVGRGELEVSLKEQAKRLGIDERVKFLGMRQDVLALLAIMDVFVLPSLSEGLSMALLEAMASGKPVVATRVGGNAELITHGKNGLLVLSENAKDLANNLIMILGDHELRRRLGEAGTDKATKQFSLKGMVEQYRELYRKLLSIAN